MFIRLEWLLGHKSVLEFIFFYQLFLRSQWFKVMNRFLCPLGFCSSVPEFFFLLWRVLLRMWRLDWFEARSYPDGWTSDTKQQWKAQGNNIFSRVCSEEVTECIKISCTDPWQDDVWAQIVDRRARTYAHSQAHKHAHTHTYIYSYCIYSHIPRGKLLCIFMTLEQGKLRPLCFLFLPLTGQKRQQEKHMLRPQTSTVGNLLF